MNVFMSRLFWIAILVVISLGGLVILRLQPTGAIRPAPLGESQPPSALTQAAFANDQDLLPAIYVEGQRRLLGAGHYLGDVGDVLPSPLVHLYVIISYEQVICARVDLSQLPIMTAPPSPVLPPVAALVKAYQALNQPTLADLAKALATNPSSKLIGQFLAAIDKPDIIRQRLSYARAHQDELIPK